MAVAPLWKAAAPGPVRDRARVRLRTRTERVVEAVSNSGFNLWLAVKRHGLA